MTRTARSIAGAAAALLLATSVAAAVPASAADGKPLTYAQLKSDPTTAAANTKIQKVLDRDFTLKGKQYDGKGGTVVAETLVHKGRMYRVAAARPGLGTRVVISDGVSSCSRNAATAAGAAASKDLGARWTCDKGVDPLVAGEVQAITPIGLGQVLDEQNDGLISFVPGTSTNGGYTLGLTAGGTRVGGYTLSGPAGGPFGVTIRQGADGTLVGRFTITPSATGSIPALAKLKK